ncbi:MAG: hypothetical protein SFV23_26955 [Planctomycetaceae bacterium]|nr:hypothetical protein [Planctomycetaceae bacterium]
MTQLAKVLVVFVAAASLGFAAFAGAMSRGGVNWERAGNSPAIAGRVSISRGDTGTYTATGRLSGQQIASSVNLAEVVTKSQKQILDDLKAELTALQTEVSNRTPQLAAINTLTAADLAGLQRHSTAWAGQLQALSAEIVQLTDEVATTGTKAQQLQDAVRELRFEVMRLRNQLELLRDDSYAAAAQRKALEFELLLLKENRLRLERRQNQLKAQLSGSYEAAEAAEPAASTAAE